MIAEIDPRDLFTRLNRDQVGSACTEDGSTCEDFRECLVELYWNNFPDNVKTWRDIVQRVFTGLILRCGVVAPLVVVCGSF